MALIRFIEDVVSKEKSDSPLLYKLILLFLRFLSLIYGLVVNVRNQLYLRGLLVRKKLAVPVISVGNILAGGAGKTPTVLYLADLLKRQGHKPAILTKGYSPHVRTGVRRGDLVTPGTNPAVGGDEPVLLARRLPSVPVLVGEDRYQSGRLAQSRFASDVLLMDDGFQYLSLDRDLDLLVIDTARPLSQDLLPRGYLREPLSGLKRAHGFLLTRVDQASGRQLAEVESFLAKNFPGKTIFHARYQPVGLVSYHSWVKSGSSPKNSRPTHGTNLHDKKAGVFVGVASPTSVFKSLSQIGICIVHHLTLEDHQPITKEELLAFSEEASNKGAECLITTEKDAVKLRVENLEILPIYVFSIDLRVLEGEERFYAWLRRTCPLPLVAKFKEKTAFAQKRRVLR